MISGNDVNGVRHPGMHDEVDPLNPGPTNRVVGGGERVPRAIDYSQGDVQSLLSSKHDQLFAGRNRQLARGVPSGRHVDFDVQQSGSLRQ